LVGLAALDALAFFGVANVAIWKAMLIPVLGDFLQAPLGLLEALGLTLTGLFEGLAGGVVGQRRHLAADPARFGFCSLDLALVSLVGFLWFLGHADAWE
jgi:hypothetical protein